VAGGVILIIASIVAFVVVRRRRHNTSRLVLYNNLPLPGIPAGDTWKVLSDVRIREKLAGGNFGEVYRGEWNGGDVALKKLKGADQESFTNEAKMLQKLSHPAVVQYLGIYNGADGSQYIVMEYLALGSLPQLLRQEEKNLDIMDLVAMAKQAAAGMYHLEASRIIHRDVALRNLLVAQEDGRYIVKISDFGLSRSVESSYFKSNNAQIPVKWCAPEVLEYGTHTTKSDVYSFGILLWELFSYGKLPFPEYNNETARIKILEGVVLSSPPGCPSEMYQLMKWCWTRQTEGRPNFQQIVTEIEKYITPRKDQQSKIVTLRGYTVMSDENDEAYGTFKPAFSKKIEQI